MVYQGKPSQGCGTCRKRRIKCDQTRPVCGQCIKSKRECLGYRNQNDLLFVSENQNLEAKAAGKRAKRRSISRNTESSSESGDSVIVPTISRGVTENTERQALTYFFSEFVSIPRHQEACRGYIEYLLPIYANARKDSPLFDATACAALAAFSQKKRASALRLQSQIYYGHAVNALQEAIAEPVLARSNETLMAIMILGLFETMVAREDSGFEWGHHADGATALANYRGDEMLQDPLSRKLYWAVKTQAVINGVIKAEPLDPYMDWENMWKPEDGAHIENHAIKLTALCSRIPALRAAGARWLQAPMSGEVALKIISLIGHAKILDQLLLAWSFDSPTAWKARVVGNAEGDMSDTYESTVYPGNIETYCDLWVANILNHWRSMRVVLQSIIINSCERLFQSAFLSNVPEYQQATSILGAMVDDTCASVPYILGHPMPRYEDFERANDTRMGGTSLDDTCQPRYRLESNLGHCEVKLLGAHYLLWPLYISWSAVTIPQPQREWLHGRLIAIGKVYGIGQAQVLAAMAPTSRQHRVETVNDYTPPPFQPYPDLTDVLRSRNFRNVEAILDLRATTYEAKLHQRWKKDFLRRLLAL